jgi:hypothetical protein
MTQQIEMKNLFPILGGMVREQLPPNPSVDFQLAALGRILHSENSMAELWRRVRETPPPKIVCLCGSTRFWKEYQDAQRAETLAGRIVLTVGFFVHAPEGGAEGWMDNVTDEQKAALDRLHLRKIDLADEVLFLNRSQYLGESSKAELAYAQQHGKKIRWLEPPDEEV